MNKIKSIITANSKKYNNIFNLTDFKNDGLMFIIFFLLIPLTSCFILFSVFNNFKSFDDSKTYMSLQMIIQILSALIGFFLFSQKQKEVFYKEGFLMFLFYIIMPIILSIPFMFFLKKDFSDVKEPSPEQISYMNYKHSCEFLSQAIYEIVFVFFAFKKIRSFRELFIQTFSENWITIIVSTCFGFILIFASSYIVGLIHKNNSNNQESLVSGLSSPNSFSKTVLIFSLFVFTVLAAPLFEEIVCRHMLNMFVSNQVWGFIFSTLFFAAMHILQTGDFNNLLNYLVPSLILSAFFSISGGNVSYSWPIHITLNLTTLIILLCNPGA